MTPKRPAQPDANATAVSPSLTRVRDATSDNAGVYVPQRTTRPLA